MTNEIAAAPAKDEFDHAAFLTADTALNVRKALGLYTEEEVAAILQLTSTGTLATWRSQKTGPRNVKLGKKVFYTLNQLGHWINQVSIDQDAVFAASLPQNHQAKAA